MTCQHTAHLNFREAEQTYWTEGLRQWLYMLNCVSWCNQIMCIKAHFVFVLCENLLSCARLWHWGTVVCAKYFNWQCAALIRDRLTQHDCVGTEFLNMAKISRVGGDINDGDGSLCAPFVMYFACCIGAEICMTVPSL